VRYCSRRAKSSRCKSLKSHMTVTCVKFSRIKTSVGHCSRPRQVLALQELNSHMTRVKVPRPSTYVTTGDPQTASIFTSFYQLGEGPRFLGEGPRFLPFPSSHLSFAADLDLPPTYSSILPAGQSDGHFLSRGWLAALLRPRVPWAPGLVRAHLALLLPLARGSQMHVEKFLISFYLSRSLAFRGWRGSVSFLLHIRICSWHSNSIASFSMYA
jgi:hypothetical protein